jgi:CxxC motif-containing protein (DUF1111 family)
MFLRLAPRASTEEESEVADRVLNFPRPDLWHASCGTSPCPVCPAKAGCATIRKGDAWRRQVVSLRKPSYSLMIRLWAARAAHHTVAARDTADIASAWSSIAPADILARRSVDRTAMAFRQAQYRARRQQRERPWPLGGRRDVDPRAAANALPATSHLTPEVPKPGARLHRPDVCLPCRMACSSTWSVEAPPPVMDLVTFYSKPAVPARRDSTNRCAPARI